IDGRATAAVGATIFAGTTKDTRQRKGGKERLESRTHGPLPYQVGSPEARTTVTRRACSKAIAAEGVRAKHDGIGRSGPKRRNRKVRRDEGHVGCAKIALVKREHGSVRRHASVQALDWIRGAAETRCHLPSRRALRIENALECRQAHLRLGGGR